MTPHPILAQKPKTGKSRMMFVSILALFAVLMAACGGSTDSSNRSGSNSNQPPLTIIASTTGAFATANFNPFLNTNGGGLFGAAGNIYEPLVFVNRYTGDPQPWLAKSFKMADDAKSVTFTLRDGVQWGDGKPFTMADVTFTLDLLKKYPSLDQQGLYSNGVISSYSTPDANTLQVNFAKPTSTALWFFSGTPIVSKAEYSQFSDPFKDPDAHPVGTGPYTLKSFSSSVYIFQKNPHYWQAGLPKVETLRYLSVNDNTAAQNLITSGQVDWAGIGWQTSYDDQFTKKDPSHYHTWFPGTNTVFLYLNTARAPFNDVRVRQAISLGIDREAIYKKAAVYAKPAGPSGILSPAYDAYIPAKYADAIKQDSAKAESLLQSAGFVKGSDGIYAKDGKKLSFNMDVPNGWSDWQSTLNVISDSLKAIGIDAKQNALATPNIYTQNLANGDYDAAISWTDQGPTPFFPLNDLLASGKAHNGSTIATGTNFEHWVDPATDKLLNQYLSTPDKTVQKQAIAGLADIVATQIPAIPLDFNVGWDEYTTTHFTGWPNDSNAFDYGSPFYGEDSTFVILHLQPVNS